MLRKRRRNVVLIGAFVFSALMHLSMVTLFRIVIYFPRYDTDFFNIAIVRSTGDGRERFSTREVLTTPSAEGAFERLQAAHEGESKESQYASLPPIVLPTLEFDDLERIRLRTRGSGERSRYRRILEEESADLWSKFGKKLSTITDALSHMALPSFRQDEVSEPIGHPAPGFDAYVEWMTEPRDRNPISVGKVQALWGVDPQSLDLPIALVFEVNRDGKVVKVIPPSGDVSGVLEAVIVSLIQYRFEPLGSGQNSVQHATLLIQKSSESR